MMALICSEILSGAHCPSRVWNRSIHSARPKASFVLRRGPPTGQPRAAIAPPFRSPSRTRLSPVAR
jgi:hypothetical protein